MEEKLKSTLLEGERVLWQSEPAKFELLGKVYKPDFIKKGILSLLVFVVLLSAYLTVVARQEIEPNYVVLGIVLLLCSLSPMNVINDGKRLKKDTLYVATDSRLIVLRDSARAVEYKLIPAAKFQTDADGVTSLLCGETAMKAKPHKWRLITLLGHNTNDEDPLCKSFAFYGVKNAEALRRVLKEQICLID